MKEANENTDHSDNNDTEEDELHELQTVIVDKGQSPLRIDKFLMSRMEKISRNRIQHGVEMGYILVNDNKVKVNYKVRPLDEIKVYLDGAPRDRLELEPEDIKFGVVYEDDDVLVINKPAGLVVHPGVGNWSGTLVNGLLYYYKNGSPLPLKQGNTPDRPGLVHRIDKDTSGLMVIAKNEHAMTHLSSQFFDHSIDREYLALVWSCPEPESGTIVGNIGRHPNDRMRMTVLEDDLGKHAVTHYEVLEDIYYVSLVKCKLETGRTHQIRVHMKHIGHPLFNDKRYGGEQIRKGTVYTKYKQFVHNCMELMPRQALHAKSLGFEHPVTGERLYFESELPEDFASALSKWRKYLEYKK